MDLAPRAEPAGIAFSGCDEPDGSRGCDPRGRNCGRTHYIAFLRNGETWAAWADADGVKIVPAPKPGRKLPASLEAFREDPFPDDEPDPPQPVAPASRRNSDRSRRSCRHTAPYIRCGHGRAREAET